VLKNDFFPLNFLILIIILIFCCSLRAEPTNNTSIEKISQYYFEDEREEQLRLQAIREFQEPTTKITENSIASAPNDQQTTKKSTPQSSIQYEEDEYGKYRWFNASCTAYCGCGKCCGKYAANRNWDENGEQIILTASGNRAVPKYTIAMSKNFKFGTKVYIEGIGMCEVMDRGGAVKGNVIDIYFDSHEEALNWGRRSIKVKIYV